MSPMWYVFALIVVIRFLGFADEQTARQRNLASRNSRPQTTERQKVHQSRSFSFDRISHDSLERLYAEIPGLRDAVSDFKIRNLLEYQLSMTERHLLDELNPHYGLLYRLDADRDQNKFPEIVEQQKSLNRAAFANAIKKIRNALSQITEKSASVE